MIELSKRELCVCFTGHRPSKLSISEDEVKIALFKEIKKCIHDGCRVFISGMACGVDMWAAEIVISQRKEHNDIKLVASVPFENFEQRWSRKNKEMYNRILNQADKVEYICPKFSYAAFQIRNEWMVNHSFKVVAVWNGTKGGTKNTVEYAKKCGVETVNIYPI